MLTSLSLQNFALAKQLSLEFEQGLTVLTGETGAGKSILMAALSACLGERTDSNAVRFGAEKADLVATFSLESHHLDVLGWLNARELRTAEGDEIILRRVITQEGRSKAWINGTPSSIADLRELGGLLVQLHSQHSQQELLKPTFGRDWLDSAANITQQAIDVTQAYHAWQQLEDLQKQANKNAVSREARLVVLEDTVAELEPLVALNYAALNTEFDGLSHFEAMIEAAASMLHTLEEDDANLQQQLAHVQKVAELQCGRHAVFTTLLTHFSNAQAELDEARSVLHQFANNQSFDPERFATLDQLLATIHRVTRKYRTEPTELVAVYNDAANELASLQLMQDTDNLGKQVAASKEKYMRLALALSSLRKAAAPKLCEELARRVQMLALPEAQFGFSFTALEQPGAAGLDSIDLVFSANKGMPLQPFNKVVSGGELSRITLVANLMLVSGMQTPVLVFDEIDVGIGGATAEIVGNMLREMSGHTQVLCITHQPQVAAQGRQHLLVEKIQADPAASSIRVLNEDERILEIARMSGGVEISQTTLAHARSLRKLAMLVE